MLGVALPPPDSWMAGKVNAPNNYDGVVRDVDQKVVGEPPNEDSSPSPIDDGVDQRMFLNGDGRRDKCALELISKTFASTVVPVARLDEFLRRLRREPDLQRSPFIRRCTSSSESDVDGSLM